MNIAVPSRFACLKVEDDEPVVSRKSTTEKKKTEKQPQKKVDKQNSQKNNKGHDKSNNNKQISTNGTGVKKEKKSKVKMEKQWEEWKEKDDEFVNGHFEQELESAILLSKLDFEENKTKYDGKNSGDKKPDKKQKKKKSISLNQFLNPEKVEEVTGVEEKDPEQKENFFDKIGLDAKVELNKDKLIEERKQRNLDIDEKITSAQYHEKIRIEQEKNKKLEAILLKAKEEIKTVRKRNQTLCTMLSTGEMKEKADVILELERLTLIKNELTDEVARLHCLLEQERSKVAAAPTDNKHKDKKHKKHA